MTTEAEQRLIDFARVFRHEGGKDADQLLCNAVDDYEAVIGDGPQVDPSEATVPTPHRYFFSYSTARESGGHAYGNFTVDLSLPVRSMVDVGYVADLIRKGNPGNTTVIIQSWQRFEELPGDKVPSPTDQSVPQYTLDLVGLTHDHGHHPESAVQFAVTGPDGLHHVYGDQRWVAYGVCIDDGSHPNGKIQRRDITITYGDWEDHHG